MDTPVTGSAWAPLRVRAFRLLWLTQLGSMIGSWMQNVGAQWLLVSAPGAETLVAMVQATAMLPVLVLALPAGAIADILDRRRLLIGVDDDLFLVDKRHGRAGRVEILRVDRIFAARQLLQLGGLRERHSRQRQTIETSQQCRAVGQRVHESQESGRDRFASPIAVAVAIAVVTAAAATRENDAREHHP